MAQAEAQRFLVLLAEVGRSRSLTMHRIYIESVQSLLDGVRRKLVLPAGAEIDLTVLGASEESPGRSQKASQSSTNPVPDHDNAP